MLELKNITKRFGSVVAKTTQIKVARGHTSIVGETAPVNPRHAYSYGFTSDSGEFLWVWAVREIGSLMMPSPRKRHVHRTSCWSNDDRRENIVWVPTGNEAALICSKLELRFARLGRVQWTSIRRGIEIFPFGQHSALSCLKALYRMPSLISKTDAVRRRKR